MTALSLRREQLKSSALSLGYQAQRAFVATMFEVLGRLLVAGAAADPVVQREIDGFPEGYTIGFAVFGDTLGLRVARRGRGFAIVADRSGRADLEIVFKHVAHAFALLSFQENSATAYANDRMVTHGDVGLSMCFMRCLDRVQAVMLPDPIASLALKSLPGIPLGERLNVAAKTVGGLVQGLFLRSAR